MVRKREALPEADQQLRDAIAALDRSGASKYFITIRRRKPPMPLWSYWKRDIPVDEVVDIRELCKSGGEDYEYKIRVHDQAQNKAQTPDGKVIEDRVIPAMAEEGVDASGFAGDPFMQDRAHRLKEKQAEIEMRKRELALQREEARLRRLEVGDEDTEEYVEEGQPVVLSPFGFPMDPRQMQGAFGRFGFNPYFAPPQWAQAGQKSETAELLKVIASALVARSEPRPDHSVELLKVLIPLMAGNNKSLEPKDMLGFVSPLIASMASAQSEASKMMFESIAESNNIWKEKVLDMAKINGADEDDVEKLRRVLNTVGDIGVNVIRTIKGGKPEAKVSVTGLPGGKVKPGLPPPQERKPNPPAEREEVQEDPATAARKVQAQRVEIFLLAHEQEMLSGSDPDWVVDKIEDAFRSLPQELRDRVVQGSTEQIYQALGEYKPEIVNRIFKEVREDESGKRKQWCQDFWAAIREAEQPEPEEVQEQEGQSNAEGEAGGGEEGGQTPGPEDGKEQQA